MIPFGTADVTKKTWVRVPAVQPLLKSAWQDHSGVVPPEILDEIRTRLVEYQGMLDQMGVWPATPRVWCSAPGAGAPPAGQTERMGGDRVRVLVVDDQAPFRRAAAAVLRRMPDFELVGEAETGEDAVTAAAGLRPDLVLMDVRLPGITGVEAAGLVAGALPGAVVVLCSTYAREDLPFGLDEPGVGGYLHKEELHAPALRALWDELRPATR